MSDLDQRVTDGLRELVGRAPVDADVWPATERYVARHRRHRHAITGAVVVVALVGGGLLTAVAVRGGASKVVVSNPGATTETTTAGPSRAALAATGPIEGSFTITAQPAAQLAFAPSALTVNTGIYAVTLVDGCQHDPHARIRRPDHLVVATCGEHARPEASVADLLRTIRDVHVLLRGSWPPRRWHARCRDGDRPNHDTPASRRKPAHHPADRRSASRRPRPAPARHRAGRNDTQRGPLPVFNCCVSEGWTGDERRSSR